MAAGRSGPGGDALVADGAEAGASKVRAQRDGCLLVRCPCLFHAGLRVRVCSSLPTWRLPDAFIRTTLKLACLCVVSWLVHGP